jgi:hypothetical protein
MQAQPLTFRTSVEVKVGAVDPMQTVRDHLDLSVYGAHSRWRIRSRFSGS